jgi:hypothetical protein
MIANWRTSLIGAVGAVATLAWPIIQAGDFSKLETKEFIQAAVILLIGFFAKDAPVTKKEIAASDQAKLRGYRSSPFVNPISYASLNKRKYKN